WYMVAPREAKETVQFIDKYCEGYRDLFPEVRSFEYFYFFLFDLGA
ncbi:DDE transposase, partial [Synechocystis sp. CACIAM 05]